MFVSRKLHRAFLIWHLDTFAEQQPSGQKQRRFISALRGLLFSVLSSILLAESNFNPPPNVDFLQNLVSMWFFFLHVQNRATTSQFTSCIDTISCTNNNICKVCGSGRTTEQAEASTSGARATGPILHRGDLEEARPRKIISTGVTNDGWVLLKCRNQSWQRDSQAACTIPIPWHWSCYMDLSCHPFSSFHLCISSPSLVTQTNLLRRRTTWRKKLEIQCRKMQQSVAPPNSSTFFVYFKRHFFSFISETKTAHGRTTVIILGE